MSIYDLRINLQGNLRKKIPLGTLAFSLDLILKIGNPIYPVVERRKTKDIVNHHNATLYYT